MYSALNGRSYVLILINEYISLRVCVLVRARCTVYEGREEQYVRGQ